MSIIPLDLERRCEQRWAARFSRVPQEHRDTPRQQQQAATGKEQGKTRQVGSAGSRAALGGEFKPPRCEGCAPAYSRESIMPQSQSLSSAIPFAAIARPACPKCKARMILASIEPARTGA